MNQQPAAADSNKARTLCAIAVVLALIAFGLAQTEVVLLWILGMLAIGMAVGALRTAWQTDRRRWAFLGVATVFVALAVVALLLQFVPWFGGQLSSAG